MLALLFPGRKPALRARRRSSIFTLLTGNDSKGLTLRARVRIPIRASAHGKAGTSMCVLALRRGRRPQEEPCRELVTALESFLSLAAAARTPLLESWSALRRASAGHSPLVFRPCAFALDVRKMSYVQSNGEKEKNEKTAFWVFRYGIPPERIIFFASPLTARKSSGSLFKK